MQSYLFILIMVTLSRFSMAGTCCLGGGPKSFIQLKDLESYQIGFSTSLRDVYGRYDSFGELVQSEKNQTYTWALGMGAKVYDSLELTLTLPWIYQIKGTETRNQGRTSVGDVLLGGRMLLLRPLFQDEWYPSVYLSAGLKFPTGKVESISNDGKVEPGTGNGIWEPYLGFTLQKDYHWIVLGFNASYTRRFSHSVNSASTSSMVSVKEGDKFDLSETFTFPLNRRFSLSLGSAQSWELGRQIEGKGVADSATRLVTLFLSPNYYLSRFWSISAGWEFAVPFAKIGANQQAYRTLSVTTNYAFF